MIKSLGGRGGLCKGIAAAMSAVALLLAMCTSALAARSTSIVVDYDTGTILHADEPDEAVFPASLTKTMTLYLLFDALRDHRVAMSTMLRVSEHAAGMPPSKVGLQPGTVLSVKDAILALVTKSANDAAVTIAENLAPTEADFASAMTKKAHELGMTRTQFRNASGLPDDEQRTTARDMVRLGMHVIGDFPEFYNLFQTRDFQFRGRTFRNHNGLLYRYPWADGLKTGYITASGFNLLASAVRGDRRLVAAVFGGRSAYVRDTQMIKLLDLGFVTRPTPLLVAATGRIADQPTGPDRSDVLLASAPAPRPADAVAEGDVSPTASTATNTEPTVAAGPRKAGMAAAGRRARGSYAVQVGAFGTKAQARKASVTAAHKAPAMLAGRPSQVQAARAGDRVLYRAYLVGLTRDQAKTACRQLAKAHHSCLVAQQ